MCRSRKCFRSLLTLLIVLAGVSICEAGIFGRYRARYCPAPSSSQSVSAPAAPAQSQPGTSATVYTVNKPVSAAAGEKTPSRVERASAPVVPSNAGWSTLPRSSWDFGKFPPYSN